MVLHGQSDNDIEQLTGWVFNTQHYSLHDGGGIRTVVFLKGCPLRCEWCCNPESQRRKPELAFNAEKCLGAQHCGLCKAACPEQALYLDSKGMICVERQACSQCLQCVPSCPPQALHHFGREMSVSDVLEVVEQDAVFYQRSGGGITLSGGEPLMQGRFALALLQEAKQRHINTALETCGQGKWAVLESMAPYLDSVYFDIKSMNDERHREYTRQGNEVILDNLSKLREAYPDLPIHVRTPLIPGFNSSWNDVRNILDFVLSLPNITYEILPYHRLGKDKYTLLGREYFPQEQQLSPAHAEHIIQCAARYCAGRYGAPV